MKTKGLFLFLIVLSAMVGLQCRQNEIPVSTDRTHPRGGPPPSSDTVQLSEEARELVGIKTEEVRLGECRSVLKAMGTVLAPQPQTAIVSHAFSGRVAEIHVCIGDWVEKGKALVTLESDEVGEAKSEFYKALADLELAQINLAREKELLEDGIGIQKNLVAAEAAEKIAQSNAEAAEKRLHVLGFTEQQVTEIAGTHQINPEISLYAPIAGKVVEIQATRGAMVDPSTKIMTIIDPRLLWVDAGIYEKDIAKVEIGQNVELTVPAYPQVIFNGKVRYIGDLVNEETRTITVRTEVANEDQRLKPGMFAAVHILLNAECRTLVVPLTAVLEDGNEKIVFVEEKECFVRRKIETGAIDGDYQQIVGGLKAGDKVVIEGNHELKSKLEEEVLKTAEVH